MRLELIQILASFLGAIGFSLIFGLHGKQLPIAAVGAAFTWGVYLAVYAFGGGIFISTLLASVLGSIYVEVLARVIKVPKTVLLFSVLVSLIPGRDLYNTMRYAIDGAWPRFASSGLVTAQYACAIALGIVIVQVLMQMLAELGVIHKHKIKHHKKV